MQSGQYPEKDTGEDLKSKKKINPQVSNSAK